MPSVTASFIILERAIGQSLDQVYHSLNEKQVSDLVDQLVEIHAQLHSKKWAQIGGLKVDNQELIVPGPVLEETFWQLPDIALYCGPNESAESPNRGGSFDSYVEYISSHIRKYIYFIATHDSLTFMRDVLPRIEPFLDALAQNAEMLNDVQLRLAHKDLHFGNILYDSDSNKITAAIDWELSHLHRGTQ